jgi:hypothetical protein
MKVKLPPSLLTTGARVALGAVLFAQPAHAFAYTDPGSGALLWQLLLSGMLGATFYFRRILNWFTSRKNKKAPDVATQD